MYEPKAKFVPWSLAAVRSMNRVNLSHTLFYSAEPDNSSNSKLTARLNELYIMSSTRAIVAREIDHVE